MGKRGPKPGTVTKTGGRQKGTPNKRTKSFTERIDELGLQVPDEVYRLLGQLDELQADYEEQPLMLKGPAKLNFIRAKHSILSDLMQYLYPKRKAVEIDQDGNTVPEQSILYLTDWGNRSEPSDKET